MAKLTDDPKVVELVEKETAKAVKAETKRATAAVKGVIDERVASLKEAGDKAGAKALAEVGKAIVVAVKDVEAA